MKPGNFPEATPTSAEKLSPSLVDAAAKALAGGEEALNDFVLEAPSTLLERFDSALSAAKAVAAEKQKAGGKAKQPMRQTDPRMLQEQEDERFFQKAMKDYREELLDRDS